VQLYHKGYELWKNALRLVFFSVLIFIDLIGIPYALSFRETVTETVCETNVYASPQSMKYDVLPEEVQSVETDLLDSFSTEYPSDIISSRSFLVGYAFRNDSTTAGYTMKMVPVYAVFISRTYTCLSLSCFVALLWIVLLNILILLIIVDPIDFLEEIFRANDKREPGQSPLIPQDQRTLKGFAKLQIKRHFAQ